MLCYLAVDSKIFLWFFYLAQDTIRLMTSKAAQELARKRWRGKSKAEKSQHAKMMSEAATAALTPEERRERAKLAAQTRWANKKATTQGPPDVPTKGTAAKRKT